MSLLTRLNAYRIMWVFVFFDLPTTTKKERKQYQEFRDFLEKDGFTMLQYSIYVRHCTSRENAEVHKRRVKKMLPPNGHVILQIITDKQFAMMEIYYSRKQQNKHPEDDGQLTIF